MCRWCDLETPNDTLTPEQAARQKQVLQLLTLVEHPDALPREDVLRLSQEILAILDEIDDACANSRLARAGLPRARTGLPQFQEFR